MFTVKNTNCHRPLYPLFSIRFQYLPIEGLPSFNKATAELLLGADSIAIKERRVRGRGLRIMNAVRLTKGGWGPVVLPGGNGAEPVRHGVPAIGGGVHRTIHAGGQGVAVLAHLGSGTALFALFVFFILLSSCDMESQIRSF